jgi:hypothetical protein
VSGCRAFMAIRTSATSWNPAVRSSSAGMRATSDAPRWSWAKC